LKEKTLTAATERQILQNMKQKMIIKKKKQSIKQSHAFFEDCRILNKKTADKICAAEQEKKNNIEVKHVQAQKLKSIAQFIKTVYKKLSKNLNLFYEQAKKLTCAQELKNIAQFVKTVNKKFLKNLNLFTI